MPRPSWRPPITGTAMIRVSNPIGPKKCTAAITMAQESPIIAQQCAISATPFQGERRASGAHSSAEK